MPDTSFVVKKGLKAFALVSSFIPIPLSRTSTTIESLLFFRSTLKTISGVSVPSYGLKMHASRAFVAMSINAMRTSRESQDTSGK